MGLPIVDEPAPGRGAPHPAPPRARYALRVSVLEQCQLDCRYCRPGSVSSPSTTASWLTPAEHALLAPHFFARGTRKVRFTGGEPTLRRDLVDVVAAWSSAAAAVSTDDDAVTFGLTTNAQRVTPLLPALRSAGLSTLTVHLDTLRADRVRHLMGDGADVDAVFAAVDAAHAAGLVVKWNVVVQRGRNDDELGAMLDESQRRGVEVRFIELMNTGSARGYVAESFVAGRDIVAAIADVRGAHPLPRRHPSDPAALFCSGDGIVFGVIASDTEPFCNDCDRLRLSADGRLRGCLYQPGGIAVGAALRAGADDAAIAALVDAGLSDKRSHHPLSPAVRAPFSMADVGG